MQTKTVPNKSSMKRRWHLALVAPPLIAVVTSCQAIGDDTPANLGSTDALQRAAPAPVEPFVLEIGSFYGRWVGTAEDVLAFAAEPGTGPEAYRFPSGSNQIVLELSDTNGISVGTLTFGEGSVPPPPVDPNVGYPVGVDYAELLRYSIDDSAPFTGNLAFLRGQLPPHEGFPYPLIRPDADTYAPVTDGLLRMDYFVNALFDEWCALQTPHPNPSTGFGCNAGSAIDDVENGGCRLVSFPEHVCDEATGECELAPLEELGPVDCNKAFLCEDAFPRCECWESGCQAAQAQAELVVRPVGDELVGVIGSGVFLNARNARAPLGAIRFRREP
jgi:hypothetical protein